MPARARTGQLPDVPFSFTDPVMIQMYGAADDSLSR
jgi:hypothetical protein